MIKQTELYAVRTLNKLQARRAVIQCPIYDMDGSYFDDSQQDQAEHLDAINAVAARCNIQAARLAYVQQEYFDIEFNKMLEAVAV